MPEPRTKVVPDRAVRIANTNGKMANPAHLLKSGVAKQVVVGQNRWGRRPDLAEEIDLRTGGEPTTQTNTNCSADGWQQLALLAE